MYYILVYTLYTLRGTSSPTAPSAASAAPSGMRAGGRSCYATLYYVIV